MQLKPEEISKVIRSQIKYYENAIQQNIQSTDTVIGAEWLIVVKRDSEKKTERRSHSIQAE